MRWPLRSGTTCLNGWSTKAFMELVVVQGYEELSRAGADIVAAAVETQPSAVLVLATGDTPMGTYLELAKRREEGRLETARLKVFQLDEYLGVGPDDPRSLYMWMARAVLRPLAIPTAHVVRLPGETLDPSAACRVYEQAVAKAGGFDLAVLGLGPNGHLGFNEPPSDSVSQTRAVSLTKESLKASARYWEGDGQVPPRALTAGMDILLAARKILLLVSGHHKHDILRRVIKGPATPDVPASYLQAVDGATIIVDRAAWGGHA